MAKRIRVSSDGTNFYTLPGNTGSLSNEAGEIEDTIFGQDFASTFPGLIASEINANGLFKGYAGYITTIKRVGSTTPLTDEPMSLVTGKTYQITADTKRIMDRSVATTVEDDGTPVATSNIESIDWLFGRVTFVSGYTPTGPITVSGAYFPTTAVGCTNAFTLTQTANPIDNTCMETAQANDGRRTYEYGLKTVSLELQGIYKASNGFVALLQGRSELIIEIDLAADGKNLARGFFRATNQEQSGDVGDLEQETVTFGLSVPDDPSEIIPYPFAWLIDATSTMSNALRTIIDAWQDAEEVEVQYLPNGIVGIEATAIVTDITLTGGLEDMNEFASNFQITGATTPVS